MQVTPLRRAALALAACAALCPRPARAMILPAAGTKEATAELAARAHQEGRALTGVLLVAAGQDSDNNDLGYGTGIYLGPAKDGRTGLVLTAAHVLVGSEFPFRSAVTPALLFGGSEGKDLDGLAVAATQVVCHPDLFEVDAPKPGARAEPKAHLQVRHDLALLEFDLATCAKDLERLGIRPVPLWEGKDYRTPLLEAKLAGFGLLGHAGSQELTDAQRIHAGSTRVSYLELDGQLGFHAWAPLKGWQPTKHADETDSLAAACLDLEPKEIKYHRQGHGLVRVQVHEQQAVGIGGDSGGPLLFSGPDKALQVAGVYSCKVVEEMVAIRTGAQQSLLRQFYVPIPDNLEWIRAVQAGEYGDSPLMTAGKEAATGQGAGTAESKVESKAETKS